VGLRPQAELLVKVQKAKPMLDRLDREDMEHYKQNLCLTQAEVAAEAAVAGMVVAVKHMQVQVEEALDIWAHP
jgi:hypothetical protein